MIEPSLAHSAGGEELFLAKESNVRRTYCSDYGCDVIMDHDRIQEHIATAKIQTVPVADLGFC